MCRVDWPKAIVCFKKAAASGHAEANFQIGMCTLFGYQFKVPLDEDAQMCFIRAASNEHDLAKAICHMWGLGEFDKNNPKGLELVRAAAASGNADAQYWIGHFYDIGQLVEEVDETQWEKDDRADSVKWFVASAVQGHARSQYELGKKYLEGEGVPMRMERLRGAIANVTGESLADFEVRCRTAAICWTMHMCVCMCARARAFLLVCGLIGAEHVVTLACVCVGLGRCRA